MKPATLAIIGAGSRGFGYAEYAARHPDLAKVTAVAEPRDEYRRILVERHNIDPENVFKDWKDLAQAARMADGAIIATQDDMHVEPTLALADKGYHIMLEKPMAPDLEGCRRIAECIEQSGCLFAVGHVLRYTPYTKELKRIIAEGRIGEIVGIQQLEPVGYWHQAHSFVRGNWSNEGKSSFMLLAKCTHDIDWINYVMGCRCTAVSSFGSLKHFRKENQPEGASDFCVDCGVEPSCPYSAKRIYARFLDRGLKGWPLDVLAPKVDRESVGSALANGPYGRCVYACDNDVVDHQVVNMHFENEGTATLTMMAFTKAAARETHVFGTHGHIKGDGSILEVYDFLTEQTEKIDTSATEQSVAGGHGGGDDGLMESFLAALASHDQNRILSSCEDTLRTHEVVFAAEKARLENRVITLDKKNTLP